MDRLSSPYMERYRTIYEGSLLWSGEEDLTGKKVVVYCEQGIGDTIQFLRYLPALAKKGCKVYVHCDPAIHPLMVWADRAVVCVDKYNEDPPDHDFHILSLDLPFLLLDKRPVPIQLWWMGEHQELYMPQIVAQTPKPPYVHYHKTEELEGVGSAGNKNIGVCWQASPGHEDRGRSCHLRHFFDHLEGNLFSLQKEMTEEFFGGCESLPLWGVELNSFLDTARLINSVEVVVTVCTSVLHLAGALNKKTCGLLGTDPDPRWGQKSSFLYPSVTFFRNENGWNETLKRVNRFIVAQVFPIRKSDKNDC